MTSTTYASDLSGPEWMILEPLLTGPKPTGRPREVELRRIVDAIFYLLRTGIQWRMLPRDYPPWPTVYYYYRQWRADGTWEAVNAALRERHRARSGRSPAPSAAIIDSQSVKTTECGGPRGYDGGKKVNGRKRHLLVDTQGNLLKAKVHPPISTTVTAPSCSWPASPRPSRPSACCGPTPPTAASRIGC